MRKKGNGERHDVVETHGEREAREDQSAKEVTDLAEELETDREGLARGLEDDQEALRAAAKQDRVVLAKKVRLKARADILIVGALLLTVTVVGWVKVNHFTSDLRDSAIGGCKRQNVVRQVVNANLRDDIVALQNDIAKQRQNAKDFKASNFGITQAKFNRLVQEGIDRSNAVIALKRVRIKKLPNSPCATLYPSE